MINDSTAEKKRGAAFNVIGERLVLSSNADLAFTNGAEKMLNDRELKETG